MKKIKALWGKVKNMVNRLLTTATDVPVVTSGGGATIGTQRMPIGTNLMEVLYFSSEMPFLNVMKQADSFATGGGSTGYARHYGYDGSVDLDSDGYPRSMVGQGALTGTTLTEIDATTFYGLASPYFLTGKYVLLYDGAGTIHLENGGASLVSTATGRQVWNFPTPDSSGIKVVITATDPLASGNYIRNIRVVYAPTATSLVTDPNETALTTGYFAADFLARARPFARGGIRFMKWQDTVNDPTVEWANRKPLTAFTWAGVPPCELYFALCNELNADGWFCMPHLANDNYVTQFATLAHSSLNSPLLAYVEYGNELWNAAPLSNSGLWSQLVTRGWAAFTDAQNDDNAVLIYGVLRGVQAFAIWKSVWGADSARVKRVLGGQHGYDARSAFILDLTANSYGGDGTKWTGAAYTHADALAVAPYSPEAPGEAFAATTADQIFNEYATGTGISGGYTGGWLAETAHYVALDVAVAAARNLACYCYEGGQNLNISANNPTLDAVLYAANIDARMGPVVYTPYLNMLQSAGVNLFMNFSLLYGHDSSNGYYWGLLENSQNTSSPKYDAVVAFAG